MTASIAALPADTVTMKLWNNCSCKGRFPCWQSGEMVSRDFARLFDKTVRKHRKARLLTQEELAERSDLAPKMISLIERFQRNPTVNVADSIAPGLSGPLWRQVKDFEDLRREQAAAKRE